MQRCLPLLCLFFALATVALAQTDSVIIKANKNIRPGGVVAPSLPDSALIKADKNIRPGGVMATPSAAKAAPAAAPKGTGNGIPEKEINTLKDTKIPAMMIQRIQNTPPAELRRMIEEYKQNLLTDEGEEIVVTVKMRFYDDNIIGWVKEAPLNNSIQEEVKKTFINIPVIYCSTASADNQEHCGKVSELKNLEETYKVTAWKMKVEQEVGDFGDPLKINGKNGLGKPSKKDKKRNKGGDVSGRTGL